ncbi:TPA: hypothetical protein MB288_002921 [Klebsiella pneumoniae]|nr:hypothetical protein [Klebsiella pneumoniae]
MTKLKKGDIASEAELLMKGTGWLSAIFRAENQQQDVVEDSQLKESENDTAVAGEQPQTETIAA